MIQFAASSWQRALLSLKSSEELRDSDPDSAASRAYYAAFHAVTSLFALRDRTFSKHSALRAGLHKDLVNTGEWHVELGKDYDFLMDLRETGDYGGIRHVSPEDARLASEAAARIVDEVRTRCPILTER